MGFDVHKKKKRKRRKSTPKEKMRETPEFKHMISTDTDLPPDTHEKVLVWGSIIGFSVMVAYVARQHAIMDPKMYDIQKIEYWYPMKEM